MTRISNFVAFLVLASPVAGANAVVSDAAADRAVQAELLLRHYKSGKLGQHFDLTKACQGMCQPDPVFSKEHPEYCKSNSKRLVPVEKGGAPWDHSKGCCYEIDPQWDTVPGYRHVADFCDKMCAPEDADDKNGLCQAVGKLLWLDGSVDPRDAVDKFYEKYPSECPDRVNQRTWSEQYCVKAASASSSRGEKAATLFV